MHNVEVDCRQDSECKDSVMEIRWVWLGCGLLGVSDVPSYVVVEAVTLKRVVINV